MSDIANGIINKVYTLNNSADLIYEVTKAVCVFTKDSLVIAGYNDKGKVLLVDHAERSPDSPVNYMDFLESRFNNKSLQSVLSKVNVAFFSGLKTMLVPKALYQEETAVQWMQKLYFVEKDETIIAHQLKDGKTNYLFTVPNDLLEMVETYLPKVRRLPLAAYQFAKKHKSGNVMECCIGQEEALATLYKNDAVYWHQSFPYENAEDIAYQLKHACGENSTEDGELILHCTTTDKELSHKLYLLAQYFPNIDFATSNDVKDAWAGMVSLIEQMYPCV